MQIKVGEEKDLLQTVYVHDFGDNYHRTQFEPSSDLEKAARSIRRRYKNITDYLAAVAIYNEYMSTLAAKYGRPELFKLKLKDDSIEEFIPAKPRMKNTLHNRYLLKNKILVSKINVNKIDEDKLEDIREVNEEVLGSDKDIIVDTDTKPDKLAKRLIKEGRFDRIKLGKIKATSNVNFLEEYFSNKNSGKFVSMGEDDPIDPSLTQLMSDNFEQYLEDTTDDDTIINFRGNYMNRQTVEELQVFQDLGQFGWDSVKIMKTKGVSKRVTKIVKNQNKMNKKESKKSRKKRAKKDDFLVSVMVDNDYDNFQSFEQDMLNFTADNIFRD